jgi:beta-mannosidase
MSSFPCLAFSWEKETDDRYVYLTQLMQAEAVGSAYSTWRRNWKGPSKEYSAGAIVWQLNDTWPVTSWAIVDYFVRLTIL